VRTIAIVGASGYGGTELLRLLARHPEVAVHAVAGASSAGAALRTIAPNIPDHAGGTEVLSEVDVEGLAAADVVVLGTPDEVSLELAPRLIAAGTRVVDLSGAFRLDAAGFAAWYGHAHTAPQFASDGATPAVYGLTEHARASLATAALVANPGCYPTATLMPLIPIAGLLEPAGIVVSAVSGTSGAGRSSRPDLQAAVVHGDVVAYGAPSHRHTAEIEAHLAPGGWSEPVVFTPHLVPMSRGILATISAVLRPGTRATDIEEALRSAYDAEPFVQVLAAGEFPRTKAVHGANTCQLSAVVDPRTGRVLVTSVIDNLVKGAAGQALQNVNVMLGLEETLGLDTIGVYP
jgi:N-acetyl-gamma-glutamyl-phosphate reductase